MSPNSTSNTMLMSAALVIASAAERREVHTSNTAQRDTAANDASQHSTPSVPQNKIMNTEERHEEALSWCSVCVGEVWPSLASRAAALKKAHQCHQ